jgi:hypothetical protein
MIKATLMWVPATMGLPPRMSGPAVRWQKAFTTKTQIAPYGSYGAIVWIVEKKG